MTHHRTVRAGFLAALTAIVVPAASAQVHSDAARQHKTFPIPTAIQAEHERIHADLQALTKQSGKTGEAAKRVAAVLHEHFQREEELALPPLGLLGPLANGRTTPQMREVLALTDRLKAEMPRMLREHKTILQALDELERVAKAELHAEGIQFADELKAHAQTEEQVLYPAALLVGEYVRVKIPR